MPMSRKDRLRSMKAPSSESPEMDLMELDLGEEEDLEAPMEDEESAMASPLTDAETDDLIAELEARGYSISEEEMAEDEAPEDAEEDDELELV